MYSEIELNNSLSAQKLLYAGCRELDYDKVLQAIEAGADVNLKAPFHAFDIAIFSSEGCSFSPLSLIAMHGSKKIHNAYVDDKKACKIANLLLARGAEIDALDTGDMGNTALHWALVTFKKDLCKLFINHAMETQKNVINMANQPAKNHYGSNPPLIMAMKATSQYLVHGVTYYFYELAELLIAAGADVNMTDDFQQSAFHWAAILRYPDSFFNLLLEKGATYQANRFGKTPCNLYETRLTAPMININHSPTSFTELGFHLIDWGNTDPFFDRQRALENRNKLYSEEAIELLKLFDMSLKTAVIDVVNEDTINEQDHMGRTRLHRAVFYGKTAEVDKLIAKGADTAIKDEAGYTPLDLAKHLQQKFTYKVPMVFFPVTEIKSANCETWKNLEDKLFTSKH